MESYVERPPLPGLAGVVRTVWIQRTSEAAYVQRHLPTGGVEIHFPIGGHPQLMPWHPVNIDTLATHLALSASQLRRRCLHAVGVSPKVLQRTLRFQGFLALAQAGTIASGRRGADGMAGLAVDVGYADQAHLSRECLRLTGLTPRQLLAGSIGGSIDRCGCGHDHSASYRPFLATRSRPPLRA